MTRLTEQEIIAGCKQMDSKCQKVLVLQYSGLLMATSRRHVKDYASAEDVLQEAFIKILRAFPKYESRGSLEGWMKKIVVNTALSYFDKACFKRESYGYDALPQQSAAPDVHPKLAAEELIKIINQLPEGFRLVFNLYAVEGYSHREIAESLGIQESTSRSQLTRARQLLVKYLSKRDKKKLRI